MNGCYCDRPRLNDRRPGYCRRCGQQIDDRWISSDETMAAFFDQLAGLPGITAAALLHGLNRERAGRKEFGFAYLGRDNPAEGQEEAADGLIYCALDWLNDRRAGTEDVDADLIDAAHHFALAHAALERKRRKG